MISKPAALATLAVIAAAAPAHAAVVISTAATQNMSCSGGVCAPTATDAVLNVTDLENDLSQFGNVTVMTTGNGVEANNIVVGAPFSSPDSTSLTLDAHKAITVDAAVSIGSGTAELELQSGKGGTLGTITFGREGQGHITFGSLSDIFGINGGIFTLVGSVQGLASAVAANPSGTFALANSYDASLDGTYSSAPIPTSFAGLLEGLGNEIQNLSVTQDLKGGANVGLFRQLNGSLENLGLSHAKILAKGSPKRGPSVGGLAAVNNGKIDHAWVTGRIRGQGAVGGIAGYNYGAVTTSWTTTSVSGNNAGGLVGVNVGTIDRSHATGRIEASGNGEVAGGLVGCSCAGTVSNSHATGEVVSGLYGGGLAAYNISATITNSYATGSVTATYAAGGLVGYNDGSETTSIIDESFATGKVWGSETGGLVGFNQYGQITNSYAEGTAQSVATSGAAGGLVGGNTYKSPVAQSYSTGLVEGPYVGGFIGGYGGPAGTLTECYWDTDTSGTDNGTGDGNVSGLTGLTTLQLQSGLPTGFDPKIWAENPNINNGLPYLINNPPPN